MRRAQQSRAAWTMLAASDERPTIAAVVPRKSSDNESPDCHDASNAGQALRVITRAIFCEEQQVLGPRHWQSCEHHKARSAQS